MTRVVIVHNHPIHYKHLLFMALKQRGLDFEVLFVSRKSSRRIESVPVDHRCYAFRIGNEGNYERHPKIKTFRFIWSSLNELDPAIVIISGYYDVAGWSAWLWAELRRRPKILWNETNSFDYKRPWYKQIIKRFLVRRFDLAHVYGKSNKEHLVSLGLASEKVLIKRAVADIRRFTPLPGVRKRYPDSINLLYVGRLAPEKNLGMVMRAMGRAAQVTTNLRLVLSIVGYGPEEQKLRTQARALGIEAWVKFEGSLRQPELPLRYCEADVFILPSSYEPWGLVALEAMLCGLPAVVSSQCGCERDLISPDTGWSFSPFNEDQLVLLLRRLSEMSKSELSEMGIKASRHACSYSPENCAEIVCRAVEGL